MLLMVGVRFKSPKLKSQDQEDEILLPLLIVTGNPGQTLSGNENGVVGH